MGHTMLHDEHIGEFLKEYDPDGNDGAGHVVWTPDMADALHFDDMLDAMQVWKKISGVIATRHDGKPNRPLTAWSVMPVKVPERTE